MATWESDAGSEILVAHSRNVGLFPLYIYIYIKILQRLKKFPGYSHPNKTKRCALVLGK